MHLQVVRPVVLAYQRTYFRRSTLPVDEADSDVAVADLIAAATRISTPARPGTPGDLYGCLYPMAQNLGASTLLTS